MSFIIIIICIFVIVLAADKFAELAMGVWELVRDKIKGKRDEDV